MTQNELSVLLDQLRQSKGEGSTVEFKSNLRDARAIGEYLSALANSAALADHQRAWIVWGVEDGTHSVKGTNFDPFNEKAEGNQSLVMWLQHKTVPRADFEFHDLQYQENRIILLEIHPARSAPISFENVRYIRIDSHKTKLSNHPDKEARLWGQLGMKSDWSGETVPEASIDDLDPDAIEAARTRFADFLIKNEPDSARHESLRNDARAWDVKTLLNKARITKGGKITRSALLLLGRDESAHFLSPVDTKLSWILRNTEGKTLSSQHFGPPFLLSSEHLFKRIRNLTIEEMPSGSLFPVAVQQYDNWVLREALHNCIAHQDYTIGGKANLVEYPDKLVLTNLGQFIPQSVEWMLETQSPPEHYRNQWLIDGMIRLRMIDQIGSGIRRMFQTQRERLLPLPDYRFTANETGFPRVEVTILGRVLDENYTKILMRDSELDLMEVLLLDKIQKGAEIPHEEFKRLRKLGLAEGRYPRIFVSGTIAAVTGGQATHIRNKGFDNEYYRDLLEKLIREHGPVTPETINDVLIDKLPESMTEEQKRKKIRNLTQDLAHRRGVVENIGSKHGRGALWQVKTNS